MQYIFDVDGTLTPPRSQIVESFRDFLISFFEDQECYLASGSDLEKIRWQLGDDLLSKASGVFTCSGNIFHRRGVEIYRNEWVLPDVLNEKLLRYVENSQYGSRFGNHIEQRIGTLNFSICGRNATHPQRQEYYEWDKINKERQAIVAELQKGHPELKFDIGGEISIDIYPVGCDKSQIAKTIESPIVFYGDKIHEGGNDFGLAKAFQERGDKVAPVSSWEDTYGCLKRVLFYLEDRK